MRRALILAAALLVISALAGGSAFAAGVYTVSGVKVDVTVPVASQARAAGFEQAQTIAFRRLVTRLTLPDELAAKGTPQIAGPALDALVAHVDVEQEHPTGSHYVAELSVSFDPVRARQALQDSGLTVIDTRTAPVLVVAQLVGPPTLADAWTSAWVNGGYGDELVPIAVAPPGLAGTPDWTTAAPAAAAGGATKALFASARVAGNVVYVDLTEVTAAAGPHFLGTLNATVAPGAEETTLQALADAACDRLQEAWKRSLAANGAQRQRVEASAFYDNQAEWMRLKQGLEGAAKTIVSGLSIDAVSRSGAMVSFSYVGGRDQLAAELRRNGVLLQDGAQGPVLKLASSSP